MTIWRDPVGLWCALGRPLARLPRWGALAALVAILIALAWSSHAATQLAEADAARIAARDASGAERIGDLELYARISHRFAAGENYYAAAMDEQRHHAYPTSPFVTVRLPTLAWLDGKIGSHAWQGIALALMVLSIMAWLGALAPFAGLAERLAAGLLLFVAGVGQFDDRALQFHELIAGAFLSLAIGIYRPQRWWPSLLAVAIALSVRELALPFVLLWGAFAVTQRRWKEAGALAVLVVLFAIGLYFHARGVAAHHLPNDMVSPGWDAMNGPQMALFALSRLTGLLFVPEWIAAPIAMLPLIGWIGLGGRLGLFASLWFIGIGLLMALFARTNNFYWVLLVLPAYAAGLALLPRALADLVRGALGLGLKGPLESQS